MNKLRLVVMGGLLLSAWFVAEHFGLRESLTTEGIRELAAGAGVVGIAAYMGAFTIGSLVQIPGIAFLLAARVAFGPGLGFVVAYAGALTAISLSFFIVRAVGGQALTEIKWAPLRRTLAKLEERPVRTVAVLRTALMVSPPLNYALAMSPIRFRDYFVGSAIGLAAPIAGWVFLSECVATVFGAGA